MTVAIVLAAGKGTRMHSALPKVAHKLTGIPLISHVHAAIAGMGDVTPLYVLGHAHDAVHALLPDGVQTVLQADQRGTGHAVSIALQTLPPECDEVLVLYGDMPLITTETLRALRDRHRERGAHLSLLSAELPEPFGYGRIIRDPDGRPQAIVEEKWLTPEQREIAEVNTGIYAIQVDWLRGAIESLPQHPDGEHYLTDLAEYAAAEHRLEVVGGAAPEEVLGINDRVGLAAAERVMRRRINHGLMRSGVTLVDPETAYIAADVAIGMDTVIEPNVWIGIGVTIGERCHVGSNSRIVGSSLGHGCEVHASVIEYSELVDDVQVGPFAHLRAGTILESGVHVGNFAEIKNSAIGAGTHMGHVSYIGDASVGREVNIGAGVITANYDGKAKHRTTIGDRSFLGIGSLLRAPVELGDGSITGAGSVVLHDVPAGTVVVGVPAHPLPTRQGTQEYNRDSD